MTAGRRTAEALEAHPRVHEALVVAAFLGVGGAGTLALTGHWPAAAACAAAAAAVLWLAGTRATPRSADAYLRRVSGALRDAHAAGDVAEAEYARGRHAAAARLERLAAPPAMEPYAERARNLFRTGSDADAPTGDRAADAAARYAEIDALRGDIAGRGTTDAERRYAVAVGELLTARLFAYAELLEGIADAHDAAAKRLAGTRSPERAAAAHDDLVAAFTASVEASRRLYAALRTGDPERARATMEDVSAAHAGLEAAYDAVVEALGDDLRWAPRDGS
jgi:hypothetical protein